MLDVRFDHGALRVLLQVRELREYERVCVARFCSVETFVRGRLQPASCFLEAEKQWHGE